MNKFYPFQTRPILKIFSVKGKYTSFNSFGFICSILLFGTVSSFGQTSFVETTQEPLAVTVEVDTTTRAKATSSIGLSKNLRANAVLDYTLTASDSTNLRKKPAKLTVFGYYRLFLYGRTSSAIASPYERAYGVGDGYREPMLSLNVLSRPNGKSSFGTELFMFTPYDGQGPANNVFTLNLGLNFYGNFRTDVGNFGVRAGGIHWYDLSSFTIGVYQVLDRFSIFDRTPWEGVMDTVKYESYYNTGSTNPGDLRWNNQAFQGIILNGGRLPGNMGFDAFWGKTNPNGGLPNAGTDPFTTILNPGTAGNVPTYDGFNGIARVLPNYIFGGKITKTFGEQRNTVSLNTINSQTALDSLSDDKREYEVHTLSFNVNIDKINVTGELGMGAYQSPTYDKKWGEALMLRFNIPKEYTFLPLDIELYQISKDFFNQNGAISTAANPEIQKEFPVAVAAGQASVGGLITQVNQLAHNRRGVNVNTGFELGTFKFLAGWGFAAELDAITSELSYVHRINGLAFSRMYNPFPANAVSATNFGPGGDTYSFFRGVFERVETTDLDPATALPTNRKYYSAIDLQGKYKTTLLDRNLYAFYLGTFGSASSKATFIPTLDDDAYMFVQYHEFDVYYSLFKEFILTGYFGIENARGGRFTDWDPVNQTPRDQIGRGIGAGFDWTIAETSGLYFRHRWIKYQDRSLPDQNPFRNLTGTETTIELKIFF